MSSESDLMMPSSARIAIAIYIAALTIALLLGIAELWPLSSSVSPDARCLLLAAFAGALGSCIHLSTSFVTYAGKRALHRSWILWYLLRPGIGAALAEVVYFALRAGLVTGTGDNAAAAINPYGVASVSALSGMFSKQATEKLREVFENFCATGASGKPPSHEPGGTTTASQN